jgi:hypothetical protein
MGRSQKGTAQALWQNADGFTMDAFCPSGSPHSLMDPLMGTIHLKRHALVPVPVYHPGWIIKENGNE